MAILTDKALVNLWERMNHIYGNKWSATFGESALTPQGELTGVAITWGSGLNGVSGNQLADGLRRCLSRDDAWPPALPEFRQLCLNKQSWEHSGDAYKLFDRSKALPLKKAQESVVNESREKLKELGLLK